MAGFLQSLGFGSSAPAAQQQQPNQQGNNNNNMQFGTSPNGANAPNPNPASMAGASGTGEGNNQNSGKPAESTDPFDKYKGMFDNTANAEKVPAFTLDDKILGDAAGAQDFMKGISPDLVQRATSGDTAALMQMMQEVARNGYKASLSHSGRLTESYVGAREGYNDKGFSKKVRGELTVNALTGTPNFKNPVVREQLTRIANDLQRQHPDAAPEEIAGMAKDYITELSKAIAPPAKEEGKAANGPVDFNDWFADPTH